MIAALDEATALSDEASAPVTAAEDLYLSLSEEEQANEAVAAAYSALAALVVTMQATVENPSVPVSYTHLDVYKRQVTAFVELFCWGTTR